MQSGRDISINQTPEFKHVVKVLCVTLERFFRQASKNGFIYYLHNYVNDLQDTPPNTRSFQLALYDIATSPQGWTLFKHLEMLLSNNPDEIASQVEKMNEEERKNYAEILE